MVFYANRVGDRVSRDVLARLEEIFRYISEEMRNRASITDAHFKRANSLLTLFFHFMVGYSIAYLSAYIYDIWTRAQLNGIPRA